MEQIGGGGDFPSRRAGPLFVLPRQGSTAAGAEQIADITSSGGPHGFHPGQLSTALLDLFTLMCTCPTLPSGWSSATPQAGPTSGTDAHKRLSGSHHLASRWSGSARGTRRVVFGTGTGAPVPVPTVLSALRIAEQIVGIPVPRGSEAFFWQTHF